MVAAAWLVAVLVWGALRWPRKPHVMPCPRPLAPSVEDALREAIAQLQAAALAAPIHKSAPLSAWLGSHEI